NPTLNRRPLLLDCVRESAGRFQQGDLRLAFAKVAQAPVAFEKHCQSLCVIACQGHARSKAEGVQILFSGLLGKPARQRPRGSLRTGGGAVFELQSLSNNVELKFTDRSEQGNGV